jgi:hypothetical protein
MSRYAISRKEEEKIIEGCKATAIKQCEPVVKGALNLAPPFSPDLPTTDSPDQRD